MTYDNETPMSGSTKSVSAMFDSQADAQNAVRRLQDLGIPQPQIRTVEGSAGQSTAHSGMDEDKGFFDKLGDFFFPEEDRYTYAEGLSRGGYLVTVTGLSAAHYDRALDILDDEGTVDLSEREASWRSEGWGGYESSPYAAGNASGTTDDLPVTDHASVPLGGADRSAVDADSIPVVEERLSVGKRDASHGRVRVRSYTVEEPVSETVNLHEEHVELERRPVDRAVTGADAFQDRTVEAEEYSEEAVVSKEARVVEEVSLHKTSDDRQETVSDTVRHTEVEVEDDRATPDRSR